MEFLSFILSALFLSSSYFLPVKTSDRKDISTLELTTIGEFGLLRKARPSVPSHLHTGIDIKRPGNNYANEPVFPVAPGKVISKRTDGPYAQLIIEHSVTGRKFWTLYEHIAGIIVSSDDVVDPQKPIARFMNKKELDLYGWQFDHFHLEILKIRPLEAKPDKLHPERFFSAFTLGCFTQKDLEKYYYPPLDFLRESLN